MSRLLDTGNCEALIYPADIYTDADGNKVWRAALTPVGPVVAMLQTTNAPGRDSDAAGYLDERVYRFRPVRSFTTYLNPGTVIVIDSRKYVVVGDPVRHRPVTVPNIGPGRTAHDEYTLRRSSAL